MEDHEGGIDDTNDSVSENNNQTLNVKMNYPHPLIKQIKQEIMEEIITNEKTTCKQNKRVNAESPSVIKKKKMKRETLLGTNSVSKINHFLNSIIMLWIFHTNNLSSYYMVLSRIGYYANIAC